MKQSTQTALGLALALLAGCTPDPMAPAGEVCAVVRFSAPGVESVCAVECVWNDGRGQYSRGYATSVPVPCAWHGRAVQR